MVATVRSLEKKRRQMGRETRVSVGDLGDLLKDAE